MIRSGDLRPGDIVKALFDQKEVPPVDPRQDALLFIGYLLLHEVPTAWRILEGDRYQCARFTDVDGTILYYVSHAEKEETLFSALYSRSGLTYESYTPGAWEQDLSVTYKLQRYAISINES